MDSRFKQANKEALLSLCLTFFYLLLWLLSAYSVGDRVGLTGLPLWFELSCFFTPILFTFSCVCIIKFSFKQISLENVENIS